MRISDWSSDVCSSDLDRGHAAATGDSGHAAATGKHAIAAALGYAGSAMAGPDGWIVLAAYDDDCKLVCVKAAKAGGPEGIKPNAAYRLTTDGEFVTADRKSVV